MGRQVNFFMTLEDETAFCQFVLSESDVIIVPARSQVVPVSPLVPPLSAEHRSPIERSLLIWNANIFAGPEYVRHHIGFYYTAGSQEGGIEFTRSVKDGEVIRAGRLWTEPAFFIGLSGKVTEPMKKKHYDRWVNMLFSWIRKRYVKYSDLFYIGPGAVQFQEMGGKLGAAYAEMDDPSKIEKRLF